MRLHFYVFQFFAFLLFLFCIFLQFLMKIHLCFCVLQQYSRPLFFVPTLCVSGTTVQSCHVSCCVSTAAWERSLGSTCLLLVAQAHSICSIQSCFVSMRPCTLVAWLKPLHPSHLEVWFCQPCHHTHISSCLDIEIRALPYPRSRTTARTQRVMNTPSGNGAE